MTIFFFYVFQGKSNSSPVSADISVYIFDNAAKNKKNPKTNQNKKTHQNQKTQLFSVTKHSLPSCLSALQDGIHKTC